METSKLTKTEYSVEFLREIAELPEPLTLGGNKLLKKMTDALTKSFNIKAEQGWELVTICGSINGYAVFRRTKEI